MHSVQPRHLLADNRVTRSAQKWMQDDPKWILSFLLLHSKPLRPVQLRSTATVCMLVVPVGMCVRMTSTPTGSQGLMISICLGSLGCHNLEFVMPYVTDLFGCCCFAGRDRRPPPLFFLKPTPLYNILAYFIWFSFQPIEIFALVMVRFGALGLKMGEVRWGMHGTDARMWSCFTLTQRPAYNVALTQKGDSW